MLTTKIRRAVPWRVVESQLETALHTIRLRLRRLRVHVRYDRPHRKNYQLHSGAAPTGGRRGRNTGHGRRPGLYPFPPSVPPSCWFADHTFAVVVGGGNQIGEFATDYIEVRRDYTDWTARPNFNSGVAIPMDARPEVHHEHSHPVAAGVRHGKAEVGSSVETAEENEHENNNEKDAHGHGQNGNGLVREV